MKTNLKTSKARKKTKNNKNTWKYQKIKSQGAEQKQERTHKKQRHHTIYTYKAPERKTHENNKNQERHMKIQEKPYKTFQAPKEETSIKDKKPRNTKEHNRNAT